jgi:hypothetical protein
VVRCFGSWGSGALDRYAPSRSRCITACMGATLGRVPLDARPVSPVPPTAAAAAAAAACFSFPPYSSSPPLPSTIIAAEGAPTPANLVHAATDDLLHWAHVVFHFTTVTHAVWYGLLEHSVHLSTSPTPVADRTDSEQM